MQLIADTPASRYPIGRFKEPEQWTSEELHLWIEQIGHLPHHLMKVVQELSEEQLDTPYREGGWTGRQVIHHIADSHVNCLVRVKLVLTEENPVIKPYDENAWAKLPDYAENIDSALDIIRGVHHKLSVVLKACRPVDFNRLYTHPQYGYTRPLAYLCALYAWHGAHHTAHLRLLMK